MEIKKTHTQKPPLRKQVNDTLLLSAKLRELS